MSIQQRKKGPEPHSCPNTLLLDPLFWHLLVCSVLFVTYVKTSLPQPAVSVKRRGPRSRAGFIAPPQLADMDMAIPRTIVATMGGISPGGAGVFLFSPRLRMHSNSMAVPTT